jgi:hypothetical protein
MVRMMWYTCMLRELKLMTCSELNYFSIEKGDVIKKFRIIFQWRKLT